MRWCTRQISKLSQNPKPSSSPVVLYTLETCFPCHELKLKLTRVTTDLCRHLSQVWPRVRFCWAPRRWVRVRSSPESSPARRTIRAPAGSTARSSRTGHGPEPDPNRTRARWPAGTNAERTVRTHEPQSSERRSPTHWKTTTNSADTSWRALMKFTESQTWRRRRANPNKSKMRLLKCSVQQTSHTLSVLRSELGLIQVSSEWNVFVKLLQWLWWWWWWFCPCHWITDTQTESQTRVTGREISKPRPPRDDWRGARPITSSDPITIQMNEASRLSVDYCFSFFLLHCFTSVLFSV